MVAKERRALVREWSPHDSGGGGPCSCQNPPPLFPAWPPLPLPFPGPSRPPPASAGRGCSPPASAAAARDSDKRRRRSDGIPRTAAPWTPDQNTAAASAARTAPANPPGIPPARPRPQAPQPPPLTPRPGRRLPEHWPAVPDDPPPAGRDGGFSAGIPPSSSAPPRPWPTGRKAGNGHIFQNSATGSAPHPETGPPAHPPPPAPRSEKPAAGFHSR